MVLIVGVIHKLFPNSHLKNSRLVIHDIVFIHSCHVDLLDPNLVIKISTSVGVWT